MTAATEIERFAADAAVERFARHVNPTFVELLRVFGYGRLYTRARDVWVWDDSERQYLDCLAGFGAVNIGHNHPRLLARLQAFLESASLNYCHVAPSPFMADLGEALAALAAPLEMALYANSGAESVEAAMKLACAATGRHRFVYCAGGYHGTSVGTLAVMGERRRRQAFAPLLAGAVEISFGDLGKLKDALSARDVAAFIVEPIQAEAGVQLPPPGYLAEAAALCRRFGALLVFDEVQTGLGRTGSLLACDAEAVTPDVLVLAKSLGGGIASIGAALTRSDIYLKAYGARDRFDWHGSTFAGNAFACIAAMETLSILRAERLSENSATRGTQLITGLRRRLDGHPLVKDIRGRGLLAAIEIGPTERGWVNRLAPALVSIGSKKAFGQWISLKLLECGIICQPAAHRWDVLKIEPPLTIQAREIDRFIDTIGDIFDAYRTLPALVADITKRLAKIG